MQTPTGGGSSPQRWHISWNSSSAVWVHSHGQRLAEVASAARLKAAAMQRQHRSHPACLRRRELRSNRECFEVSLRDDARATCVSDAQDSSVHCSQEGEALGGFGQEREGIHVLLSHAELRAARS